MAEKVVVIEDYFTEGTNRTEQGEASPPVTKTSDYGGEEASIRERDEQRQTSGVVPKDQGQENRTESEEQDKESLHKMTVENRPQEAPAATEAADFLLFRRSVIQPDTLLE